MDSLKPTEIVVSFSCLSYWNEMPLSVTTKDETKTRDETRAATKLGVRDKTDRESRLGDVAAVASEAIVLPDAQPPHATGNQLMLHVWLSSLIACLYLFMFLLKLSNVDRICRLCLV